MEENRKLTKRQFETLSLIAPYPMGDGKSYKKAAKKLNCSVENVKKIISSIKKNSPEIYGKLQKIRIRARKDRDLLKLFNIKRFDSNIKIREKF